MGLTKLIYAADFDPTIGVGAELITRQGELTKQASTIFGMDYSDMKPDDRHVGIHVVALGDAEHYQFNRNGDGFPKEACVKYHDTFVKNGHVFRHHVNKDPEKSIGIVKASAYNEPMGRIELFIHADKDKAAPELERLEKEGEIPFSMACTRAGTPVLTRNGFKPVESVSGGDFVLTHNGNWRRVSRTMRRSTGQYCRVSFVSWGDRVLEITPNHSVYAVSFDDVPGGCGKDRAGHPGKGWRKRHRDELHKYLRWVPAGELTSSHYMCVPTWPSGPESVGADRARLYGYYIAGGSLCAGGVAIACNVNDVFVDEIEKLAEWTSVSKKGHRLSEKCVNVACFSTQIRNELESACGRRRENKRIPESIRFGSLDEKFNFVAAWFNGDGWQDRNGLHWGVHPRNLAIDLQTLLASMGVRSSCDMIGHGENRGPIKSKNAVEYVVTVSNESSGLFSDISKAKEIYTKGSSKTRPFFSGGYLMVPVKSVEMVDEPTEVYNFSVEDDESYTVYGLAVHNCRVPNDRCSICGAMRKHAGDESECDHVANHLGELFEDGRQVGTFNDQPTFFDISFVGRPADRIAWNLKVATALPLDSVKAAEMEGVVAPDELSCDTEASLRKLGYMRDIASMQGQYRGWLSKQASVVTARDGYLYELRRAPMSKLADDVVSRLRELPEKTAYTLLGRHGVVMDVPTFFKYATGDDYGTVMKPYMKAVSDRVPHLIEDLVKRSEASRVCNDTSFDALAFCPRVRPELEAAVKKAGCMDHVADTALELSGMSAEPKYVDTGRKSVRNCGVVEKLAETYATYQMSALDAVLRTGGARNKLDAEAVISAGNVRNTNQ